MIDLIGQDIGSFLRLVFLIVFVGGVAAFLYIDRKKINRHAILFYRRTQKGIDLIDKIASKAPRFWKAYGSIAIVFAIISIFASSILVGYTFFDMFQSQSVENGPSFIAPGLVSQTEFQPGISFIPVEYWVIAIAILMVFHEFSHGIVARTEGFEINSVGWIILGIIPGAFVEPKGQNMLGGEDPDSDVGMWEDGTFLGRLKVLSAGSFANYLVAAMFFAAMFGFTAAATNTVESGYVGILVGQENGSVSYQAQQGQPAYESGMRNGTLSTINGEQINTLEDLQDASNKIKPNESVTIDSSEGTFQMTAVESRRSVLKPQFTEHAGAFNWFANLLFTVAIINVLVGLFNMLPVKPLDGGLITEALLERVFGEERVQLLNSFSGLVWILLIGTMILGIFTTFI